MEVRFGIENIGKGVGFLDSYHIAHEICRDGQQGNLPTKPRSDFARIPLTPSSRVDDPNSI
jgi:hypothetical protein